VILYLREKLGGLNNMMTELFSWREMERDELYTLVNHLSMTLSNEFGKDSETSIQCRDLFNEILDKFRFLNKK
jgi:hypothetical protein